MLLFQIKGDIGSYVVPDEGIKSTMKKCWDENGYLLCPHTAIAVKYHYDHRYVYRFTLLMLEFRGHLTVCK